MIDLIKVNRLCKSFKDKGVLNNLSFNVSEGEIFGFIGKNGAGKTTTMNILAGLSKADSGKYEIIGKCGYLPEEPKFYSYMTGMEYLKFLGRIIGGKSAKEISLKASELLELSGLADAAFRKIAGYSRGMKQRLGLASELLHNPQVLLLDEPSSALDPGGRADMSKLLKELKAQGVAIMLSTHILSDMESICDRVGIISQGKIALQGALYDILKDYASPGFDISFSTPAQQEDINKISELSYVKEVTADEERLLLKVCAEDPDENIIRILPLLSTLSAHFSGIWIRRARLEEVFERVVN